MESAIALIMTMLVLGIVGIPLLRERKPEEEFVDEEEYEDPELDKLLAQKETALEAIRELEFDHAVGSLSDDDYADLRGKYERKAISVLKNLKEMDEVEATGRDREEGAVRAGQEITCPECGMPYGGEDRFCASCGAELEAYEDVDLACPECGEPYEEGDVYCASCGAEFGVVEEELARAEEYIAEGYAEETPPEEAVQSANPASDNKPKRQTRRTSSKKKTASNNGKRA